MSIKYVLTLTIEGCSLSEVDDLLVQAAGARLMARLQNPPKMNLNGTHSTTLQTIDSNTLLPSTVEEKTATPEPDTTPDPYAQNPKLEIPRKVKKRPVNFRITPARQAHYEKLRQRGIAAREKTELERRQKVQRDLEELRSKQEAEAQAIAQKEALEKADREENEAQRKAALPPEEPLEVKIFRELYAKRPDRIKTPLLNFGVAKVSQLQEHQKADFIKECVRLMEN